MVRELDQRRCAGLIVTLEWDSDTDQVRVRCEDEHTPAGPRSVIPSSPATHGQLSFIRSPSSRGKEQIQRTPCHGQRRRKQVRADADAGIALGQSPSAVA
jgi:hypothetical protein